MSLERIMGYAAGTAVAVGEVLAVMRPAGRAYIDYAVQYGTPLTPIHGALAILGGVLLMNGAYHCGAAVGRKMSKNAEGADSVIENL